MARPRASSASTGVALSLMLAASTALALAQQHVVLLGVAHRYAKEKSLCVSLRPVPPQDHLSDELDAVRGRCAARAQCEAGQEGRQPVKRLIPGP